VNPRPSEDTIRRHFVEEYIDSKNRVEEHFVAYRERSLEREARIIRNAFPSGARLLDLGTASGAFLGYFTSQPEWQVEGIEPSRFAARAARERYGVPVHEGFLADHGFENAQFDVITSLDAFFFHPTPDKDLREIKRILKPNGIFAVEIPGLNFRLLKNTGVISKIVYGESARLNAGVHLFFYYRYTLGRLLAKHGFSELAAHPEQSPIYGNPLLRIFNNIYYHTTSAIYRSTKGRLNLAPKEFILYRKEN
jgi:SAM-dependent methyltransferase